MIACEERSNEHWKACRQHRCAVDEQVLMDYLSQRWNNKRHSSMLPLAECRHGWLPPGMLRREIRPGDAPVLGESRWLLAVGLMPCVMPAHACQDSIPSPLLAAVPLHVEHLPHGPLASPDFDSHLAPDPDISDVARIALATVILTGIPEGTGALS